MERKIKFRGKDEQGEWQEGHLLVQLGTHYILTPIWEMYRNEYVETDRSTKHMVNACTVGQFTGLLDKNGNEIYEGDIVEYDWYIIGDKPAYRVKKQVVFDDMGARVGDDRIRNCTNVEVVGNIHDNPELLKTETL